jgi:adenylate cyclase
LDKIRVKGRKNSVGIYQLMGRFRNKDNQTLRLIETYESAWQLYLEGDFASALEGFKTSLILERYPSLKNPSKIMIERCTNLIESPPESWDGVFTYTSK